MRMNQVIKEDQQLDELSLGGIGRGLEKAASGVAKGVGYAAGIPTGLGQAFQQGKARAVAGLSGTLPDQPKQPKPVNKTFAKEYERLTGLPWGDVPPEEQTKIQTSVSDIDNRIRQVKTELDRLMSQRNSLLGASHPQATKAAPGSSDKIEPEMGEVPPSGGLGQAFQQGKAQAVAGLSGERAPEETEPSDIAKLAGVTPTQSASVAPTSATPASAISTPHAVETPPSASAPAAPAIPTSLTPKSDDMRSAINKVDAAQQKPNFRQAGSYPEPTMRSEPTPPEASQMATSTKASGVGKEIPKQFQQAPATGTYSGGPTSYGTPNVTYGSKPTNQTASNPAASKMQTVPTSAQGGIPKIPGRK